MTIVKYEWTELRHLVIEALRNDEELYEKACELLTSNSWINVVNDMTAMYQDMIHSQENMRQIDDGEEIDTLSVGEYINEWYNREF